MGFFKNLFKKDNVEVKQVVAPKSLENSLKKMQKVWQRKGACFFGSATSF